MKVVKSVSFDVRIMQKIDDYMLETKTRNFSQAVNFLIQMGMAYYEQQKFKPKVED